MASIDSRKKSEKYKTEHRRERNKILKIRKHLRKHPNDTQSYANITRLQAVVDKK